MPVRVDTLVLASQQAITNVSHIEVYQWTSKAWTKGRPWRLHALIPTFRAIMRQAGSDTKVHGQELGKETGHSGLLGDGDERLKSPEREEEYDCMP
ncbi:hypothetical protein llap_11959 [Limosa lapponica baueri]|uniref:Uncharacterized protein n=1 Tax=Limosa lapponica baueri TaxID=1758121 RepID=A0A2I0TVI8_LIMLA|nr:hypothetical protein llap_11959 [Limosa lapponica baueri]